MADRLTETAVDYSSPAALTPVELRDGLWYKREDLHAASNGVNGAKYRACRHLIETARAAGFEHVVTAQSVQSPQAAIAATIAAELDMECTVVVGASKPHTAVKHVSIRKAVEAGAYLDCTPRVAYNGVIQPYGERLSQQLGAYQVPYAISPPSTASQESLQAFLEVGGWQATNLPELETLVMPFGSGNTTAGVLYGLSRLGGVMPERIVLVGIGPDRTDWLRERLTAAGAQEIYNQTEIVHVPLHGWFVEYSDQMPETRDGLVFHPGYEGKVVRYLDSARPSWWTARDGSTCFWVVGGPM